MCPLTIKVPITSIIVPTTNSNEASDIAFHGIFVGGSINYNYFKEVSLKCLIIQIQQIQFLRIVIFNLT